MYQARQKMLDAIISELPAKFDSVFGMAELDDHHKGACSTYSRILTEVLGEFRIKARVQSVYILTANIEGLEYLKGKMTSMEAGKRAGRIQVWGDIAMGQVYQHAVCYIPQWSVVVDLAMAIRGSGLVPSHPYWAELGKFPWWVARLDFKSYRLEYRAYEVFPARVKEAKKLARELIRKEIWKERRVRGGKIQNNQILRTRPKQVKSNNQERFDTGASESSL